MKVAAYERELIGLVQAVRHWRPYLWGRSFVVRTDHYALKFMLDQRLSTIPQHQWISKLFGYDFKVEYKPGKLYTDQQAIHAISSPSFQLYDDLKEEIHSSPTLCELRDDIVSGRKGTPWQVKDDLILYSNCASVSADSPLLDTVLHLGHTPNHEGTQKTLQRLRASFYVDLDRRLVKDFVRTCTACQCNKVESLHPAGLLQPLPVPSKVWADISMDFIEALLHVHGKSVTLTVVDRFSKYAHFIPLGHPYTATYVA